MSWDRNYDKGIRSKIFECCHKCTKRHVGCHGTCPDYADAKKASDEYSHKVYVKTAEEASMKSYARKAVARMKATDSLKDRRNRRKAGYITKVED